MVQPVHIDIEATSDTQTVVLPDPLTVARLNEHRAKAPKLVAGVAAWSNSDMFKVFVRYRSNQVISL
jgi:hypothetical protein